MEVKIIKYGVDSVLLSWVEGSEFGETRITYDGKGFYKVDAEYISLERLIRIIKAIPDSYAEISEETPPPH